MNGSLCYCEVRSLVGSYYVRVDRPMYVEDAKRWADRVAFAFKTAVRVVDSAGVVLEIRTSSESASHHKLLTEAARHNDRITGRQDPKVVRMRTWASPGDRFFAGQRRRAG